MTPLSGARRQAEEALAIVAQRYPNGWGSYDTLSICTSALRAILDATGDRCHRHAAAEADLHSAFALVEEHQRVRLAAEAEVARLTKALAQIGQWPCSEGYEGRECPDQPEQNGWLCAACYARRALAGGGK